MNRITSTQELKNAIIQLELERNTKGLQLKEEIVHGLENLNPFNLFSKTLNSMGLSHKMTDDLMAVTISLAAGFFSRKIFVGSSRNIIRKLLGNALELGVIAFATQNTEAIKSFAQTYFRYLFGKFRVG
jgi:hypothetical protein